MTERWPPGLADPSRARPAATRDRTPAAKSVPAEERASIFLHPGQMLVATEPTAITTILGSCVALCLYDPGRRIGGMNHYLLPHAVAKPRFPARFGTVAITRLVERMEESGCRVREIEAKVFGGAGVVRALRSPGSLGAQNVEIALEALRALGIPLRASDVGGERGRKLVFHTDDGSAWVRTI